MKKETSDFIAENWFVPERFYAKGFPKGTITYLKYFPPIVKKMKELIKNGNFKNALEIGPGKQPVIKDISNAVFLDASKFFLRGKAISKGERVLGRVEHLPFKDNSFDLVIANDVLTNVRPENRVKALSEMARVSRGPILVFEYEILDKLLGTKYPRDWENHKTKIELEKLRNELMPKAGMVPIMAYKFNSRAKSKINKRNLRLNLELIFAIKGRLLNSRKCQESDEGGA